METERIDLGQIVCSKAGRDNGRYFIVIGIPGGQYVLMADGDIRKIEKPKKKKLKHLIVKDIVVSDIKDRLLAGARISNSDLRTALKTVGLVNDCKNEEV